MADDLPQNDVWIGLAAGKSGSKPPSIPARRAPLRGDFPCSFRGRASVAGMGTLREAAVGANVRDCAGVLGIDSNPVWNCFGNLHAVGTAAGEFWPGV